MHHNNHAGDHKDKKENYLLDSVNDVLVPKFIAMHVFNMKNCKFTKIN